MRRYILGRCTVGEGAWVDFGWWYLGFLPGLVEEEAAELTTVRSSESTGGKSGRSAGEVWVPACTCSFEASDTFEGPTVADRRHNDKYNGI